MTCGKETVLIFRIGSIGDTLVALPAFHLIRKEHPASRIVLLTNTPAPGNVKAAPSHQILVGTGLVDDYLEYPHLTAGLGDLMKLLRALRRLRPVKAYYLMPVRKIAQRLRDTVFFRVAGIRNIHGLWPGRNGDRHLPVERSPGYYESEASRLLRTLGYDPTLLNQRMFSPALSSAERAAAEEALCGLGERRFIALSVGTKVPAKDWGQDRWTELIDLLSEAPQGFALVFVGSADERGRCQGLLDRWPYGGLNFCGQLSPRGSAAILERAALFLGHDSGPMHLASSVGVPCVGVFSARKEPGIWFPFGNEANVFYNSVACRGCGLEVCTDYDMICIRSIRPHDVAARARSLLLRSVNGASTQPVDKTESL